MSIRRVMIEDGDAFMRLCTKKLLVENGFEVVETANGIEAIWETQPDTVLMNITKPDKDDQAPRKEIVSTITKSMTVRTPSDSAERTVSC